MARGLFKKVRRGISKGVKKARKVAKGTHKVLGTVRRVAARADRATGGLLGDVVREAVPGSAEAMEAVRVADDIAKHPDRSLKRELQRQAVKMIV